MGAFEDDDNRNGNSRIGKLNVDSLDFETQQIDSQYPGGDLEDGEIDEFCYLNDTMPFDESYLLGDAFETQLLNLDGETQVVDIGDETQVLDDLDCMKNMPIDFLNDYYTETVATDGKYEGTNKTEAFFDTQVLSQNADSAKTDDVDLVGLEKIVVDYPPRQGLFSGSFTSIRTASMRASGLAARERGAANRNNMFPTSTDKSCVEQESCDKDNSSLAGCSSEPSLKNDNESSQTECIKDTEDPKSSNKCKFASATARKLFEEDGFSEIGKQIEPDIIDDADDNLEVASQTCLARLSYANSQEPGELSQAHALEVVDKFLDLNVMDIDERVGMIAKNSKKSKVVDSGAKGLRELAKKRSVLENLDDELGIYEWDDNVEDDHGGDFFLKKKELFFEKRRCHTEPRKPKGGEMEKKCIKNKSKVSTISGPILRKLSANGRKSVNCGEKVVQKNLVKDLEEQLTLGPKSKMVEKEKNEDVTDVNDIIDLDTQMADGKAKKCTKKKLKGSTYSDSVSMLRKLRPRGNNSLNCGEKVLQDYVVKDSDKQLNVGPEPNLLEEKENEDVTDIGPDTQLAAEAMDTLCFELLLADDNNCNNPNKAKATCEKEMSNITAHSAEHSTAKRPFCPSVGVVTRRAKQIKRAPVVSTNNESSLLSKQSDLTGQRSEKKPHLENHLKFYVPVAHRTRKSMELHRSKAAAKTFDNRDETNHAISTRVTRKSTVDKEKKFESNGASAIDNNLPEKRSRQECIVQADAQYNNGRLKRSKIVGANSISTRSGKKSVHQNADDGGSRHDAAQNDSEKLADAVKAHDKLEASPVPHGAVCRTPTNNASPICMGDEYYKQSCRKNLSRSHLITEIRNVVTGSPGLYSGIKESRKRKDITSIRVLFSQHLDEDVIKHQKKILTKLGGAVATFMSDATHFVAEEFVRTRNMLEAIASGKPVVTRLWLESCGQASCLIDEKNYIFRDSKKEKEFGFCLPDSLSRACQHPILQGQKVFVTPNTKPGKEIIAKLVKAVHGLVIERVGRSIFNDKTLPDDLLVLSCEEDYDVCVPFLEKGGAIYSSELLLNGIVKQKLEFERHRIFEDHVKRTRSTIWMKKKNGYLPVKKRK
ncbi:hypothetical protein CASFOL_021669 [Castilleja foliolosa]|uniref:BRCT domain-containing protein n=1 Tax=Castilleja foliolosa TaxID=1961234 RepID=A0ABD3D0Z5_9LAMI